MRRSYRTGGERNPIYLVLENRGQISVLFWRAPYMSIRPLRKRSDLLNCGVRGFDGVADGEVGGVEDSYIAAKAMEDSGGFEGHKL